jgi:transcriptional regulator of acetoin/glycerol metabolism
MSLREVEGLVIDATLQQAGGNISASAKILGIDRTTLYNKIKAYRLAGLKNALVPCVGEARL